MKCLIRLVQVHETFRLAELYALANLASTPLHVIQYSDDSPFCIVEVPDEASACQFISRGILSYGIYELWGSGKDYNELHAQVQSNDAVEAAKYGLCSFRFKIDSFQVRRSSSEQRMLIESFSYLPFEGPILMNNPELEMCVFEDHASRQEAVPRMVYLGRQLAKSGRRAIEKYDLKKRRYISRTSMDAELSLVTANLMLAAAGKFIYDPFVGTGSFSVAAAHFGASALGSDIDSRSIRGTNAKNLFSNFIEYKIESKFLDSFVADLTHSPLRVCQMLDGVVCDPPYGIREGPKVLGYRAGRDAAPVIMDGQYAHLNEGYIPPKRPYGFEDMLADVLDFSFVMLVDDGRLCMWMPTADEAATELVIPSHPGLELLHVCVQQFNKWSRRLLTYRRLPTSQIPDTIPRRTKERPQGSTADELNPFRKQYFQAFRDPSKNAG